LIPNSRKGIFLGFIPNTDKHVIWYDTETHVVKIAKHVCFDEGMNDLPPGLVPPDVVHLQRTQNGEPLPAKIEETSVDQFTVHLNPFSYTMVKGVQVTDDNPSYGLTVNRGDIVRPWSHGAGSECSVLIYYSHNSHSLFNYTRIDR